MAPNYTMDDQVDSLVSMANAEAMLNDTKQDILTIAGVTGGVPLRLLKDFNTAAKRYYAASIGIWKDLFKAFPVLAQAFPAQPDPPASFVIANGAKEVQGLIPFAQVSLVTDGSGLAGLGAVKPPTVRTPKGTRTFNWGNMAVQGGKLVLVGVGASAVLSAVYWLSSSMRAEATRAESHADQVNLGVRLWQKVFDQCSSMPGASPASCAAQANTAYGDLQKSLPTSFTFIETLGLGVAGLATAIFGYRVYVRYSEGRWPFNRGGGSYALTARSNRRDDDDDE